MGDATDSGPVTMAMSSSIPADADSAVAAANEEVCPAVNGHSRIGSSWRLILLYDLLGAGEKRFNELKGSTGANPRTLSRVLDDLEEAGLVHRRVEERSLATYYRLTEMGGALEPVSAEFEAWAAEWIELED